MQPSNVNISVNAGDNKLLQSEHPNRDEYNKYLDPHSVLDHSQSEGTIKTSVVAQNFSKEEVAKIECHYRMGYFHWLAAKRGYFGAFWDLIVKPSYGEILIAVVGSVGLRVGAMMARKYWLPRLFDWLGWGHHLQPYMP